MLITITQIVNKADEVLCLLDKEDNTRSETRNYPIKLEIIKNVISDMCSLSDITIYEQNTNNDAVYGMIQYSQYSTVIRINGSMTDCWKRFVTCKELCHIVINDIADRRARCSTEEEVYNLVNDFLNRQALFENSSNAMKTEEVATYLATLIIYPEEIREPFYNLFIANKATTLEIATKLRIPELLIKHSFSELQAKEKKAT